MNKILILIVLVFSFFTSAAADDYRVEPLCPEGKGKKCMQSAGRVDFILPPESNLKFDDAVLEKKYRYHFVKITNLSGDYRRSLTAVQNAEYYYSKNANGKEIGVTFTPIRGWGSISSGSQTEIIIRFDYGTALSVRPLTDLPNEFKKMAVALLLKLSQKEYPSAASISQSIIEKLFELVPIPSEASLGRYVSERNAERSFVLLNPKIKLRVDTVERVLNNTDWHYALLGTQVIEIDRNSQGEIIQTPFLELSGNLPNNEIDNSATDILEASTADIQMSKALQSCQFVFLFQNGFKKNNKKAADTGSTDCVETGPKPTQCNSVLYHFKQATLSQIQGEVLDFANNKPDYTSFFGNRNLITPLITIYVNGLPLDVPLYTTLNHLQDKKPLSGSYRIYRIFNRDYERLKATSGTGDLYLLPNDKISF